MILTHQARHIGVRQTLLQVAPEMQRNRRLRKVHLRSAQAIRYAGQPLRHRRSFRWTGPGYRGIFTPREKP